MKTSIFIYFDYQNNQKYIFQIMVDIIIIGNSLPRKYLWVLNIRK